MFVDIEETLQRELREVAGELHVPAMPPLPQEQPKVRRAWQPLLVAAAVALLLVGGLAVLDNDPVRREPQPVTPSPSPTPTESVAAIPTTAPRVPYVLNQRLYVDGARVPGGWWSVTAGDAGWLGLQSDYTWWWGSGPAANKIEPPIDLSPVISPNGEYTAFVKDDQGRTVVTGLETRPGGQGMGAIPVYAGDPAAGDPAAGDPVRVRAVTDDGKVIVQGTGTALLWLPFGDNSTVDLTSTAPGKQILGNTPAGLVVTDGEGGEPYLAEMSDSGELTRTGTVPAHDDLAVSPGARWLVWTPIGTTGGEVTAVPTLEVQTLDGSRQATLTAPSGWGFAVRRWAWENDDYLVSPVLRANGEPGERLARCGVEQARCVLITGD